MKKIIISAIIVLFALSVFCQQTPRIAPQKTSAYYLEKSKRQNTIGLIFLGTGAALGAAGLLIPKGDKLEWQFLSTSEYENGDTKLALGIVGLGLMGGSIGFFAASSHYKNKAKAVSAFIDVEKTQGLQAAIIKNQSFPVVGVKIKL